MTVVTIDVDRIRVWMAQGLTRRGAAIMAEGTTFRNGTVIEGGWYKSNCGVTHIAFTDGKHMTNILAHGQNTVVAPAATTRNTGMIIVAV